jgi:AcrR family transcriptional regulator
MSRVQRAGLRQGIIQTSLEIGSERGEEGLTMRGIAARLGVSATALYQHFESKAKILREIRIYGAELLQTEVLEPAASIDDPAERLVTAGRNYVQFARSHKWLYSVMMGNEQLDWSQHNAEETELLLRPLKTYQAWLQEGAERSVWRAGLDVNLASFRIWMSVHGLCTMLLSGRISEGHPAFPSKDEEAFIDAFNTAMVDSMKP